MLTAHTIKLLQSLDQKKYRQKYDLFLVEGNKIIRELKTSAYQILDIYTTDSGFEKIQDEKITKITETELKKISFLKSPKDSVAVCRLPPENFGKEQPQQIILDGIQDPGNLGTIIRLADWFGIQQIICSKDTVDLYNSKVIQATKGSFARVSVFYTDLQEFLAKTTNQNIATDMDGENFYKFIFPENFNLILGNEGNGIRESTMILAQNKITIPRFGQKKATESLNVSMAAGIILGQIFSGKV